ncbi:MAG: hypothetical protein AAGK04_03445 [Planctomycetota bacterium]
MPDVPIDRHVRAIRARAWSGPDQSPKVEALLERERTMSMQKKRLKHPIAIIIAATVTSGALATVITDQVLSRRATLETENRVRYGVELREPPIDATGKFVADDGAEYHIRVDDLAPGEQMVTVDVDDSASDAVTTGAETEQTKMTEEPQR